MLERWCGKIGIHGFGANLLLASVAAGLCGCGTTRYYAQAIRGEYVILSERRPVASLLADPQLGPALRHKFELVERLRAFAQTDLNLPINRHYLSYVDLHRRFAVWNVHAAPEFSLQPRKWWYPFVGSLKYRGYFVEEDARRYAERLAKAGDDVYVEGVEAYSTLGWFADPLLNTFIQHGEPDLAEIIFHELAHQELFVSGDTDFNEAFATAVSQEGVRRWLAGRRPSTVYGEYQAELRRDRQFVALVMEARRQLGELYGENERGEPIVRPRPHPDPEETRFAKARIIAGLRARHEQLKASWGGYRGYDAWFSRSLNNAQLNTIAVYYQLVPGFEFLIQRHGGDLRRFYEEVRHLSKLPKKERHRRLLALPDAGP